MASRHRHCRPSPSSCGAAIAAESNPALLRLQKAAATHNVSFVWDDEAVSVGSGRGAIAWPVEELPRPRGR